MPQPRLVRCEKHSPLGFCYVQRDGSHVTKSRCRCFQGGQTYSANCPVDLHRDVALGKKKPPPAAPP